LTDYLTLGEPTEREVDGQKCHQLQLKDGYKTILSICQSRLIVLQTFEEHIVSRADMFEHLERDRFKSISSFVEWLILRKHSHKELKKRFPDMPDESGDFPVRSITEYKNVQLNVDIPLETFRLPTK
jgi:hypothetical protein